MAVPETLRVDLCRALDKDASKATLSRIGGGDSHAAGCLEINEQRWFVKWNSADRCAEFRNECESLTLLAVEHGPVLPGGIASGSNEKHAWLITQWLDLHPRGNGMDFGKRLAALHGHTHDHFGWHTTNALGASRQQNRPDANWRRFWWSQRLEPQLKRAMESGLGLPFGLTTLNAASDQLLQHDPCPALVHGDLWSGNHAFLKDGTPVIFDPAPYYGDRETDLAMMRLFGGFESAVFGAYEQAWPLPKGHEARLALYQSYHLLNHYNLFGPGWRDRVMQRLWQVVRNAEDI